MTATTTMAEIERLIGEVQEFAWYEGAEQDGHREKSNIVRAALIAAIRSLPGQAGEPINRTTVDSGALTLALNVLRRAGKREVADALADTADRLAPGAALPSSSQPEQVEAQPVAADCKYCERITVCAICGKGYAEAARQRTLPPLPHMRAVPVEFDEGEGSYSAYGYTEDQMREYAIAAAPELKP